MAGEQNGANMLLDDIVETDHASIRAILWLRLGNRTEHGLKVVSM